MFQSSRRLLACAAAFGALSLAPFAAHASTVTFSDFSSTAGLTLVGNAATAVTGDGTVLRVSPANYWQAGAAYSTSAITLSNSDVFSTQFQFRFTNPGGIDPADGITFVLAANPTGLGASGFGIGYYGLQHSVAIEFDTYDNGEPGTSNHVALDTNGGLQDQFAASPYGVQPCNFTGNSYLSAGCMSNGDLWTANIGYDGTTLSVRLRDGNMAQQLLWSQAVDIAGALGTNQAYVGFSSATGAGFENHDIVNWQFSDTTSLTSGAPEPATWAMMLLGFGGLGAAMRRRRKVAVAA
jgi:hypothetical protein